MRCVSDVRGNVIFIHCCCSADACSAIPIVLSAVSNDVYYSWIILLTVVIRMYVWSCLVRMCCRTFAKLYDLESAQFMYCRDLRKSRCLLLLTDCLTAHKVPCRLNKEWNSHAKYFRCYNCVCLQMAVHLVINRFPGSIVRGQKSTDRLNSTLINMRLH